MFVEYHFCHLIIHCCTVYKKKHIWKNKLNRTESISFDLIPPIVRHDSDDKNVKYKYESKEQISELNPHEQLVNGIHITLPFSYNNALLSLCKK